MHWQHLLHAKCFKVGILQIKTPLYFFYFFLWKFQMSAQDLKWISILLCTWASSAVCLWISVLFFLLPFFFFCCQQLLSFSLSHVALSSLSLKKKDPNFMERHVMEDLRAERERMQRVIERHARRRRFINFFNALI